MPELDCIYITNEQAVRLVGISGDALIGMQITGDASDKSAIQVASVDLGMRDRHYVIEADGEMRDVT